VRIYSGYILKKERYKEFYLCYFSKNRFLILLMKGLFIKICKIKKKKSESIARFLDSCEINLEFIII